MLHMMLKRTSGKSFPLQLSFVNGWGGCQDCGCKASHALIVLNEHITSLWIISIHKQQDIYELFMEELSMLRDFPYDIFLTQAAHQTTWKHILEHTRGPGTVWSTGPYNALHCQAAGPTDLYYESWARQLLTWVPRLHLLILCTDTTKVTDANSLDHTR